MVVVCMVFVYMVFPKRNASVFKFNRKIKIEVWNIDGYHFALISFISIKILCNFKQISKPSLVQDTQ
jgi:hypothetical protein